MGNGLRISLGLGSGDIPQPRRGDSIAVNGCCLTVVEANGNTVSFDAVTETVSRSNLANLSVGVKVNLEPALRLGDGLDGHIVQGHVDAAGSILQIEERPDSWIYTISLPENIAGLVAEKGSVAIDGISLTVVTVTDKHFSVSIIPLTWQETTLCQKKVGSIVNLEADVLARYTVRWLQVQAEKKSEPGWAHLL